MRAERLIVEQFNFLNFKTVHIKKMVNNHGYAKIIGQIDEQDEQEYINKCVSELAVNISIIDENGSHENFFCGILQDIQIHSQDGFRLLEIEIVSYTKLMDLQEKTFSYQNAEMTFDELLDFVKKPYDDSNYVMTKGQGETLKELIVQYRETDWNFCKRMASHFNTIIVPEFLKGGVKFHFGIPTPQNNLDIKPIYYTIQKSNHEFLYKSKNKVEGIMGNDSTYYEITSREILHIGDKINFKGKSLRVYNAIFEWTNEQLMNTYQLKPETGFLVPKYYNNAIMGASLEGEIIDVKNDLVKTHLYVDEKQEIDTAKWFDYSTVYSSPDGAGWYAMPEIDDNVRLYFPTEIEKESYVISAVHVDDSTGSNRINPNDKSIYTIFNKEILLQKDAIYITNHKDSMIILDDEEGISLRSKYKIKFIAKENISVISDNEKVELLGKKGIYATDNDTLMYLEENKTVLKGSNVLIDKKAKGVR